MVIENNDLQALLEANSAHGLIQLLFHASGYLYWKDSQGRFKGCNRNFCKLFRVAINDVIGKTHEELWGNALAKQEAVQDRQLLEKKCHLWVQEQYRLIDGKEMPFLVYKTCLFDAVHQEASLLSVAFDISKRKEAEFQQAESQQQAYISSQVNRHLIEDMQSSLSKIVHMIQDMSEQIISHAKAVKVQQLGASIHGLSDHLLTQMKAFLDYSQHFESTGVKLKAFDIKALGDYVFNLFEPLAAQKAISFNFYYEDNLPTYLWSDGFRVKHILINLLEYTFKFTGQGKIRVDIFMNKKNEASPKLCFSVHHDANRYQQAKQVKVADYAKDDLAMLLVYKFLKELGGESQIKHEEGKGDCLTVILPVRFKKRVENQVLYDFKSVIDKNQDYQLLSLPKCSDKNADKALGFSLKKRVLLVEDSPAAQQVGAMLLEELGCEISIAVTSVGALAYIRQAPYDFIYMDIGLPDQDGLVTTRLIREWEASKGLPRTPIIALTVHVDLKTKAACLEAGIDDVVRKPMNLKTTLDCFKRYGLVTATEQYQEKSDHATVVDWQDKHLGYDRPMTEKMLRLLINTFSETRVTLKQAYDKKDWDRFLFITHKFYGGVCYCPTPKLKAVSLHLEKTLQSDRREDQITIHYQRMLKAMQEVEEEMGRTLTQKH